MERIGELIVDSVETTYENIVKNDSEYKKLEHEKNEIISKLKAKLIDDDFQELEKLIDCFEG